MNPFYSINMPCLPRAGAAPAPRANSARSTRRAAAWEGDLARAASYLMRNAAPRRSRFRRAALRGNRRQAAGLHPLPLPQMRVGKRDRGTFPSRPHFTSQQDAQRLVKRAYPDLQRHHDNHAVPLAARLPLLCIRSRWNITRGRGAAKASSQRPSHILNYIE